MPDKLLNQDEVNEILLDCAITNDDQEEVDCRLAVARALKEMGEQVKDSKTLCDELVIKQLKAEMARLRPQARRLLYGEK